jgi:protein involved in plasmid replication-relaxation
MATTSARRQHYEPDPTRHVVLGERDLDILAAVFRHRFLSSHDILSFIEGSTQQVRKRLRALMDAGYLMRVRNPAPRASNAGSLPLLYGITNLGADMLAAAGRAPRDHIDWTRRNAELNDPSKALGIKVIPHTVGVASVMLAVERYVKQSKGAVRLITEREILATLAPAQTQRERHPFSWHAEFLHPRVWRDDRGEEQVSIEPRRVGIAPDKVFGLEFSDRLAGKNRLFYFLEYDRATSAVTLSDAADYAQFEKSSIYKKLVGYSSTWAQGVHTKRFGLTSFQVLVITESQARVRSIVTAFALMQLRVLPAWTDVAPERIESLRRIFRFTFRASVDPNRLLHYAWVDGMGAPKPLSLPEGF